MKGLVLKSVLSAAALLLCALNANATTPLPLDYTTPYMVTGNNSYNLSLDTSGNFSYAFNEQPWVYIKLKLSDLLLSEPLHVHWTWTFSDGSMTNRYEQISLAGLTTDKELWSTPPEPWWTNHHSQGDWNIRLYWFSTLTPHGYGNHPLDFTIQGGGPVVTPEPLSATLFLLGGAPILAVLRKRLKTA